MKLPELYFLAGFCVPKNPFSGTRFVTCKSNCLNGSMYISNNLRSGPDGDLQNDLKKFKIRTTLILD